MRTAQKQEILEFIKSMNGAHEEIRETLKQKDVVSARNMLAECQEFAIELGNVIEKFEGEDCPVIPHIEAYCETLYRLYEGMGDEVNEAGVCRQLEKKLLKVENSVKGQIPIRKEVVFFPYKASMWDSLESVYLAAKADSGCDVYCVPVPYYDLNGDGSLGQMHYEGRRDYPDYVEIIDWMSYKVEERRPDIIYIHNPYDDCNLVTRIHPDFYAKRLKQYTDMLVYIPYFIAINDQVEEHFCTLPGILYADRVIVQSGEVRETYIQEFRKFERENNCRGRFGDPKEKIIALGSPKIDRVMRIQREDVKIPEEWQQIIRGRNGSHRKVVFYNTTIESLLKIEAKALDKIEDTIRLFEKMPDVVLLWRPHPLLESTMRSMRPMLLKRYRAIVDRYRTEKKGIFDNTADLERAIAITDAYYGDMSSVVELYKTTGKPVMIQNYRILYQGDGRKDK